MAISLNTWYTTSDTGGSVKLTGGASSSYYQTRLRYKANSNNISTNKTNITVQLQVRTTSSSYNTYGPNQTTTIQGTALSAKAISSFSVNTWVTFGERTFDVEHNSDGSKTVTLSGSFTTTATTGSYGNYALKSGSVSTSVILPTIPRASAPTLSASSIAMGSILTITTNRVSDSFTHTLTYSFGSASGTIANNVGASTTWTPPIDLANQIPSATSGTCTITCQTYNGSTLIGTKTVTVILTVPSSVVPSISSIALSEAGSTPSNWGCYVQNKSKLKVVTTASGSYGSSIKSYKITGIDSTTYASSNFTSNTLTGSGTKTITATVTDSRGRTATKTTTYTCVAYSNPSISNTSVARCNSDGTDNEEGTYVKYTFKASVSSVNSKNSHVFKIGYKETSSSTYTYVTIENDGYSLDKSNVVLSDITFSENSSYDFQFWVNDYFITTVAVQALGTGFTLMDFNASGKGMAIGKASEKDAFEVAMPSEFTEKVLLKHSPPNFGACREDTVSGSYVRLFTVNMTAQYKSYNVQFNLCDTQAMNEIVSCDLYVHHGSDSDGISVYKFKFNTHKADFVCNRLVAVVVDSHNVGVYFKMNNNDSPAVSIVNTVSMRPNDDAYGKITIDCSTVVSSLPSGTQTTATGGMWTSKGRIIVSDTDGTTDSTFFEARRTDTNKSIQFGIGGGGQNRGIYDSSKNAWILCVDENNNAAFNGEASNLTDSGWENASLSSNFSVYSSTSVVRYRKYGKIIFVQGEVKPNSALTGSSSGVNIFTLPSGFRPSKSLQFLCQGSVAYKWLCTINSAGNVNFSRYSKEGSGYVDTSTSTWLPFNFSFIID